MTTINVTKKSNSDELKENDNQTENTVFDETTETGRPFGISKKLTALIASDVSIGVQLFSLITNNPELFSYPVFDYTVGELLIGALIGINAIYLIIQGGIDLMNSFQRK